MSEHKHTNHLINESSPYLQQHAHNPVDWYPWGPEALEKSRAEDKPILLSVGYAAFHWCHVMEHESFEYEAIAQLMNDHFVCIKVDREEPRDIDPIYMNPVQMMTGHGGCEITMCLSDALLPVDGGTYFPPSMSLMFLLRYARRTNSPQALQMVETTLKRMAAGGMYDHLGGGFARYSVDARWLVPHFEKMLYDNALLARTYLYAYQQTRNADYRRVAEETFEYIIRDMTDRSGGFYSPED